MKEIPILFSTPMVQAILAGRKMQTRRIVQPMRGKQSKWLPPGLINSVPHGEIIKGGWQMHHPKAGQVHYGVEVAYDSPLGWVKCPYGQPGDLLYVRETWFPAAINADSVLVGYHEKDPDITIEITTDMVEYYWKQLHKGRMIPSIHMPKEAARIWLQVTDVRVERLQDISEDDAQAEGVEAHQTELGPSYYDYESGYCNGLFDAKDSFRTLWKSINGVDSWESNPWVWAINFKVLSTTGKPDICPPKS